MNNNDLYRSIIKGRFPGLISEESPVYTNEPTSRDAGTGGLVNRDPGLMEGVARYIGDTYMKGGADQYKAHRFGRNVTGLLDWTTAGDVALMQEGQNRFDRARPSENLMGPDTPWDKKEAIFGAGETFLGGASALIPFLAIGKPIKQGIKSASKFLDDVASVGDDAIAVGGKPAGLLGGPKVSLSDYEKSQRAAKRVPRSKAQLRKDIKAVRDERAALRLLPGDPLDNFGGVAARLQAAKRAKAQEAVVGGRVEAVRSLPSFSLWGRDRAKKIESAASADFPWEQKAAQANTEAFGKALKKDGWTVGHKSKYGGRISSRYYEKDGNRIRVSDHELPMTPERESRAPSWDDDIVVGYGDDVDKLMAGVRETFPPRKAADHAAEVERRTNRSGMGVGASRERIASTGQYVGAPAGIDTPEKVEQLQKNYIESVLAGVAGRNWYNDSSKAISRVAPSGPNAKQHVADILGTTSAGTGVNPNLGFTVKGINQRAAGTPVETGRFPQTHSPTIEAILDGKNPSLGPKREPFAANLSVEWNPDIAKHPVHDIWDGRAHGYVGPNGKPWEAAFSGAQHEFMDRQNAAIVEYLNANKIGGFDDWDALNTQAAAWTGKQIQDGVLSPEDAAKHYGSFFDKHQASGTYEQVTGAGTGHLDGITGMSYDDRKAFSDMASWNNERGQDSIYSSGGLLTEPTGDIVGAFKPKDGALEINPGNVARPLVQMESVGGSSRVLPNDLGLMNTAESGRAFVDVQNAGAGHKVVLAGNAGDKSSVTIKLLGDATPEQMGNLDALASKRGFFAVDAGNGRVNLINDIHSDVGEARTGTTLGKDLKKGGLLEEINKAAGDTVKVDRAKIEPVYQSYEKEWAAGEGSREATAKFLDDMGASPEFSANIEPALMKKAAANLKRDAAFAKKHGLPVRKDIQTAMRIFSKGGYKALRKAMNDGVVLPAVGLALLAPSLLSAGQSDDQQKGTI